MGTPFYSKIAGSIGRNKSKRNSFFSPISIRTCLVLSYIGAEGNTAEELKQVLNLIGDSKKTILENIHSFLEKLKTDAVSVKIINRFFVNSLFKINPEYNRIAREFLEAGAENVDFNDSISAMDKINSWVEDQSQHKIENLILSTNIDLNTTSVLVSATYFKGEWEKKFVPRLTEKRFFTASRKRKIRVDMMFQINHFLYGHFSDLEAYAIEMPYKSSDMTMLVLMPKAIEGLNALEKKMMSIDLTKMSADMRMEKLHLGFPKFKFEFDVSLQPILEELGIKTMFTANADFSNLSAVKAPEIYVSEVKHKAIIEVDENGTEVNGSHFTHFTEKAENLEIRDFILDHPFFFAIIDKEHVYFAGHITDF